MAFEAFPKLGRISKTAVVTEKIDGTNAQIYIPTDYFDLSVEEQAKGIQVDDKTFILAGSRNRWLSHEADNFGFWHWVEENKHDLAKLGPGRHFGEWWGQGIQRGYGLTEKRFSLFNALRWNDDNTNRPASVYVVPVIGHYTLDKLDDAMSYLREYGSFAAPGFMNPEGIVIYNDRTMYKRTFEYDKGKWTGIA
jgi:hypothetical protein